MLADINMIKELGANGVVIGPLTTEDTLDKAVLEKLLEAAAGLEVTIHRAIDYARNQVEAMKFLREYKEITTILTAGGDYNAAEAIEEVNELIALAENTQIKMMIGGGLDLDNLSAFLQEVKPINALHFGSGVRVNGSAMYPLDENIIKQIKEIMTK